jgi:hypothetical protein
LGIPIIRYCEQRHKENRRKGIERIQGRGRENIGNTEREYKEYNKETNTKLNIYYAKNRLE